MCCRRMLVDRKEPFECLNPSYWFIGPLEDLITHTIRHQVNFSDRVGLSWWDHDIAASSSWMTIEILQIVGKEQKDTTMPVHTRGQSERYYYRSSKEALH